MLGTIPTAVAFLITSPVLSSIQQQQQNYHQQQQQQRSHPQQHRNKNALLLQMASSSTKTPNFSSTDPFQILGIDPTADTQAIKRAYKKLAFQYHPDMVTTKDSTAEQKRKASDQFAKISAAYEAVSGKTGRGSSSRNSSTSSSSNNNPNAWTPPHRRTSSSSSSTSSSTDWRDYVPYNTAQDDQTYDAGGDSFGAIFADLFAGASSAAAAGGRGGVVRDFIEFLEQTVDAYSTTTSSSSAYGSSNNNNEDADLQFLLQAGSIRQVGDEMDETELVLQQLNKKMQQMDMEVMQLQTDVATCTKFTQKMELEESLDELRARKRVAENYIQKARKRLLALQTRYKALVVQGANDPKAGGSSSRNTRGDTASTSNPPPSSSSTNRDSDTTAEEESWKDESFGSFGRGRGSSRRRAQRSTYESASTTAPGSASSSSSSSSSYNTNNASSNPSRSSTPASSIPSSSTYIPPHRRTQASSSTQDDQRRLREIKVDEEFEKLKRDLGL